MPPEFRTDYWHDSVARAAFIRFIEKIHRVNFTLWEATGYWDNLYRPFSLFQGEELISNVCIYSMAAVVNGRRCQVAQVSGVGTLPEWRKRGLNRELTTLAIEWARHDHAFAFLFADDDAIPFYRKCGFRPVRDHAERVGANAITPRAGLVKMDLVKSQEQRDLLFAMAQEREMISNRFGNITPRLVMYHALYGLRNCAYHLGELGVFLFMKRTEKRTIVFDIIGSDIPPFEILAPYLATEWTEEFEFRFHTDKLGIKEPTLSELPGSNAHLWGECALGPSIAFPETCHA